MGSNINFPCDTTRTASTNADSKKLLLESWEGIPGFSETIGNMLNGIGETYTVKSFHGETLMYKNGDVRFVQEPPSKEEGTVYKLNTSKYYVTAFDKDNDGYIDEYIRGVKNKNGEPNVIQEYVNPKDDGTNNFKEKPCKEEFDIFKPSTWF